MKTSELREKNDQELDRMLAELRDKVRELRFRIAARQQSDVREVRETRQAIARILTLKRSRKSA